MFYSKRNVAKPVTSYKIVYSTFNSGLNTEKDENLLPHKRAKIYYNYDIKSGALQTGIGFEKLTLPKTDAPDSLEREIMLPQGVSFNGVWHFKYYSEQFGKKDHFLIYYGTDNNLYWCKLVSMFPQSCYLDQQVMYFSRPNALQYRLNGKDVMIFTEPSSNMMVWPPEQHAYAVEDAPKVVSMCLHYERLFAIVEGERVQLRFSDDLDVTNWTNSSTEGGYIELLDERGPMNKVVSFGDYIYVFRDFGITRVTAFGEQSEFSASGVHTSSAKIYGGSVAVCGNRILYLCGNGIYTFDGVTSSKLSLGIDNLLKGVINDNCCSAYLDNKYYLACKLNFDDDSKIGCESYNDGYTNNALIELDLISGEINIARGVDIVSMTAIAEGNISKLVCCFGGEHSHKIGQLTHSGCVFGQPLTKAWVSPMSDMGFASKKKIVKKITFISKNNAKIVIKTEKETKEFNVLGKQSPQSIFPKVVGEMIEISFLTDNAESFISKPEIIVGVIG